MQALNVDPKVAAGFGDEWRRFDQTGLSRSQLDVIFQDYFSLFPWQALPRQAIGADFGCGSGRWALAVAPRAGKLFCVDASSEALDVARRNLAALPNCEFQCASVEAADIAPASLDFAYSLGVLHHTPNPQAALRACVAYLRPGAPFLLYLYYRFDNRPTWFRMLWAISDRLRRFISRSPYRIRYALSQLLAAGVYWPLARAAALLATVGFRTQNFPLSYYSDKAFYVMRTDALDRFGTRVEHRFTRAEMREMMEQAGLHSIEFSSSQPYWCAVGYKS